MEAALNIEFLPRKPYCTDNYNFGLVVRKKEDAIKKKHIQINPPTEHRFLIFDIDRAQAGWTWHDNNLPCPNWAAINPKNGHAHIAYRLNSPVFTGKNAHIHPILYCKAVHSAYVKALKADANYSQLITKNPLNDWHLIFHGHNLGYDLGELAEYVKLNNTKAIEKVKKTITEHEIEGRNCQIFNLLRDFAYKNARDFRKDWDKFYDVLFKHASEHNANLDTPLTKSEVRSIVKSVHSFILKNDSYCQAKFRKRQAWKGAKGGKKSKGGGRPSMGQPWEILNISRRMYFYRKKAGLIS
ncbi:MAG: replication initiation protein [Bacteroidota bacterium]